MSMTASQVPSTGVSTISNDLKDYRILALLHRIITFLQDDSPKSQVLPSTKHRVIDCSKSLFGRILQVIKRIDTAEELYVHDYRTCSETIWKLENALTLFTEAVQRISPVEILDFTLNNSEFLDFKEIALIMKAWNRSRNNLRKAVDDLCEIETDVVGLLPQGIPYEGIKDLPKDAVTDAISILELCIKNTRAELLTLYRKVESKEDAAKKDSEKDPNANLPNTIFGILTNINDIMTNKAAMFKASDEHIMLLIDHVMIIQVTVTVNNRGKASPRWSVHISHTWQEIKKFSMNIVKYAKKIGQVSIRDLKQEAEKDVQEVMTALNDQPSDPPNGHDIPDFSSMIISLTTDALRVARPFHQQSAALVCLSHDLITEFIDAQGNSDISALELKPCIDAACSAVRSAKRDILDFQNSSDNNDIIKHFQHAFRQLMGFILNYHTRTQWNAQYAAILRTAQTEDASALVRLDSLSKELFPPEPEDYSHNARMFSYEVAVTL